MPGLWYKLRRLDGRGHFKALFTSFSRRALHKDIGTCSIFKLNIGVLIYYIMINYGQKYHVRNSLMQILLLIVWPPSLHKVKNIVTINFRCLLTIIDTFSKEKTPTFCPIYTMLCFFCPSERDVREISPFLCCVNTPRHVMPRSFLHLIAL